MYLVNWFSSDIKKPRWLLVAVKLVACAVLLFLAVLITESESPLAAEQHWWWNIH
jgi:hypothetical protein